MEAKFDVTLLCIGDKKEKVEKLMLEYIHDADKVVKFIAELPCRIILNVTEEESKSIRKKFKKNGADIICMPCDIVHLRDDKLNDLFS